MVVQLHGVWSQGTPELNFVQSLHMFGAAHGSSTSVEAFIFVLLSQLISFVSGGIVRMDTHSVLIVPVSEPGRRGNCSAPNGTSYPGAVVFPFQSCRGVPSDMNALGRIPKFVGPWALGDS